MIKIRSLFRSLTLVTTTLCAACGGTDAAFDTSSSAITSTSERKLADFDGDGASDLVVTNPSESINVVVNNVVVDIDKAGAVTVLYGAAGSGVSTPGSQIFSQQSANVPDSAESWDLFGTAVTWGDFNADGFDDLATSAMGEDAGRGVVHVLYGSAGGLTTVGNQIWSLSTPAFGLSADQFDYYGQDLDSGDFNADGADDLAIAIPGYDGRTGAVHVLFGRPIVGLVPERDVLWTPRSFRQAHDAYTHFGEEIAVGDVNGDGVDDLMVGGSQGNANDTVGFGFVHVLVLGPSGTTMIDHQYLTKSSVPGQMSMPLDYFGARLATGDFDGDGRADLAASAWKHTVSGHAEAGAVAVFRATGPAGGIDAATGVMWSQDSAGIAGVAAAGERFGTSLNAADFNGDGRDDLAIGAELEGVNGFNGAGTVTVIAGSPVGLVPMGNQLWTQASAGVAGDLATGDHFGEKLVVGDFDADGRADLAVTVVGEQCLQGNVVIEQSGAVHVLYGAPVGALTSAGSQLLNQNTLGVPDMCELSDAWGS